MISGFPFPSGEVNITYPPEFHEELGDYPIDYLGLSMRNRTPQKLYQDFLAGQAARGRVALDFLRSGDFDFLWLVFTGTDKVQHFFWRHMDPNHPNHEPELVEEFGDAILDLWRKQDAILGEMLAEIPEDALVLVLSDHGFDAIYRQVNMANWTAKAEIDQLLDRYAIPKLLITNGLLHHFLEGRLPGSSDREAFLDDFLARFGELRDPETGLNPIESAFRREEIYEGRLLEKAPDVVFHETPKYYVTRGIPDSLELPIFQNVWSTSFSAHHRPEGIVAIRGGMICPRTEGSLAERLQAGGDFQGAHITDVTPTLLALMDEVIPDEMDGRPLDEVFCSRFLAEHPARIEPVEGFLLDWLPSPELSEEERERLRALPYIQ
jgi:predicted AlkP superfamily phosphohydrolase/phosphomutase